MKKFTNLNFRPMLQEDLPQVLMIENTRDDLPWPEYLFQNYIKDGHKCLVIEKNKCLFAYAILQIHKEEAHLVNICVTTEEQGKGYGSHIMQHLFNVSRIENARKMSLFARESKTISCHFYYQLGFRVVKRLTDYYQTAQGKEDALVFELELN